MWSLRRRPLPNPRIGIPNPESFAFPPAASYSDFGLRNTCFVVQRRTSMIWLVLLLAQSAVPTQIERGETIFVDPARGCAGCHALKGKGTAVGPDLKDVAH